MKLRKLILDNLDVSQTEFCKRTEISRMTLYNILNKRCKPTLLVVNRICKYFGVNVADYID